MQRYLGRKLTLYGLTLFFAVTVNWMIPRFMPGDPVRTMLARTSLRPDASEAMFQYYTNLFGLDVPIWDQYLNFWKALFAGDLGTSIWLFPAPVSSVIVDAVPYTLALLVPAIILSWIVGNTLGALAARRRWLDNTLLPMGYVLTATPYVWMALLLAWLLAGVLGIVPHLRRIQRDHAPHLVGRLHRRPGEALVPALLHPLPGRGRGVGHRHAQHDHLRARVRLRPLPGVAWRTRDA